MRLELHRRALLTALGAGFAASRAIAASLPPDVVRPADFGAIGDGVSDDSAAIAKAIAHALARPGSVLQFDDTTYSVGTATAHGGSIFLLDGASGFTMRGRPHFRCSGTNARQVTLFDIQMSNVDMEYVEATGDAWAVRDFETALTRGLIACMVRSPGGQMLTNHRFGTVRASHCWGAVLYDANPRSHGRAADVNIGLIEASNTIYGFNGANAPDNHVIGRIVADNIFRGYFVYGLDRGKANILVKPAYSGLFAEGTCVNIAVYTESAPGAYHNRVGDTRNIEVSLRNLSSRPSLQLSTTSMAPTDRAQGHYSIRVSVESTAGSTLKVANADSRTSALNLTAPFASPKRDIAIFAHLSLPYGCLDYNSYGVWSDTRGLSLECSNFLDCPAPVRHSYVASGWHVRDLDFGYDSARPAPRAGWQKVR
jgi:hypothetical protein